MMSDLETCLINHEGLCHYAYTDSLGLVTVGIGRNLSIGGSGLSTEECLYLLRNDIFRCKQLLSGYTWFHEVDSVRQEALIELCFNMGLHGLLEFTKMLQAFVSKDYDLAATELLTSKWAKEVHKDRADNIANRIRTGNY